MRIFLNEFIEKFADADSITKQDIKEIKKQGNIIEIGLTRKMRNLKKEILNETQTELFAQAVNNLRKTGAKIIFNDEFTPEEAIEGSRKLNSWINEIKNARVDGRELTAYEKYQYAFDIASQFIYNPEGKNESEFKSRKLLHVLNGDKIVCVGYQSILRHICQGLDIPCAELHLSPTVGNVGHSMCLVYMDDPEYNMSGYFVSDPTAASPKAKFNLGQTVNSSIMSLNDVRRIADTCHLKLLPEDVRDAQQQCMGAATETTIEIKNEEDKQKQITMLSNIDEALDDKNKFAKFYTQDIENLLNDIDIGKKERISKAKEAELWKDIIIRLGYNWGITKDNYFSLSFMPDMDKNFKDLYKSGLSKEKIIDTFFKRVEEFKKLSDQEKINFMADETFSILNIDALSTPEIDDKDLEKYILTKDKMGENAAMLNSDAIKLTIALKKVAEAKYPLDSENGILKQNQFYFSRANGWTQEEKLFEDLFNDGQLSIEDIVDKINETHQQKFREKTGTNKENKIEEYVTAPIIEDYNPEKEESLSKRELPSEEITVSEFIEMYSSQEELSEFEVDQIKELGGKLRIKRDEEMEYNDTETLSKEEFEQFAVAVENLRKYGLDCVFTENEVDYTPEEVIYASTKINDWVQEIQNTRTSDGKELSPYEKFTYAYDIASQFSYKFEEEGEGWQKSRNLISVLNGDSIVCVGFQNVLRGLCNGLGLKCSRLHIHSAQLGGPGHSACLVYLEDDKYNIDGYFVSDPTGGCTLKESAKGQSIDYQALSIDDAKQAYLEQGLVLGDTSILEAKDSLDTNINYKQYKSVQKKEQMKYLVNIERGLVLQQSTGYKQIMDSLEKTIDREISAMQIMDGGNDTVDESLDSTKENPVNEPKGKELTDADYEYIVKTLDKIKQGILSQLRFYGDAHDLTMVDTRKIQGLLKTGISKETILRQTKKNLDEYCKLDIKSKIEKYQGFEKSYLDAEDFDDKEAQAFLTNVKPVVMGNDRVRYALSTVCKARWPKEKYGNKADAVYYSRNFAWNPEQEEACQKLLDENPNIDVQELVQKIDALREQQEDEEGPAIWAGGNNTLVNEEESDLQTEQEAELQLPTN